jgi:hypothetical protein
VEEDDVDLDDKDEGTYRIDDDPERNGKTAPSKGAKSEDARRRGEGRSDPGQQPGGGRRSESEKPSSPDSRWGGGRRP